MKLNIIHNFLKYSLTLLLIILVGNNVNAQTANFSTNPNQGCAPIQIQCTDLSTGASSWAWSVNTLPPLNSSIANPGFTFLVPGTYTITLNINGGVSTFSQNITIFQPPQADFIADITSGCAPLDVQLTDLSIPGDGAITNYVWDYGGTSTSSDQNPFVTYLSNGELDVELVITDANGCQDAAEIVDYINVDKPPIPIFSVNPSASCQTPFSPTITNSTDQNQAGIGYQWSFPGTGVIPPATSNQYNPDTVTYTQNGTYDITLTVDDNGCLDDTTIVGAVVIDQLVADFSIDDNIPCQGQTVTFIDNSSLGGLIYLWYDEGILVGNNSPIFTSSFSSAGSRNICLVVSTLDGVCRDSICKTVDVKAGPSVDFSADNVLSCGAPFTANFTSTGSGAVDYLWTVSPATATPSTSTLPNPSFTFNVPNNYTISLTVTSANGCKRTITKNNYIKINDNISASITSNVDDNEGCAPLDITFNISANLPAGITITSVDWNLPGGSPSGGPGTPTKISTTYGAFGDYVVTATINFSGGCSQTITSTQVQAGDLPTLTANVTPIDICLNESVTGSATSNIPGTQFNWYFESPRGFLNGGIGSTSNVTYLYEFEWATPFEVLLVGDVNGCKDTVITEVTVNPPAAQFEWEKVCGTLTEVILKPNIIQGQFADNVDWYLVSGPGSPATLGSFNNINNAEITVDFGSIDVFEVQLVVSSAFTGCTDSITITIDLINSSGNASVTPNSICPGENVSFFDDTPGGVAWQWIFGDGDTSTIYPVPTNVSHVYDVTGTYTAYLITRKISGNAQCIDTTQYPVYVGGGVADITGGPFGSCSNSLTSNFTAGGTFLQGGPTNANWIITTDAGTTPEVGLLNVGPINYNDVGEFPLSLTVFDSIGCSDDTTVTILVGGAVADFNSSTNDICPGEQITFTNLSLGGNLTYNWSFPGGSPDTSTDQSPVVTYGSAGQYDVTLLVTSSVSGSTCTDTTTKSLFIRVSGSGFDFVVDKDSANCPPLISNFKIVPTPPPGALSYIKWYFELSDEVGPPNFISGDELENSSTGPNIYLQGGPDGAGYYDVALVLDGSLCRDSIYKDDFIFVGGQRGSYTFSPDTICAPDQVLFNQINVERTDTIFWDFGDGQTANNAVSVDNIPVTYVTPGVYTPVILLKTQNCPPVEVELGEQVFVSKLNAFATVDQTVLCDDGPVEFRDSSVIDSAHVTGDVIVGSIWEFGDGNTAINQPSPIVHNYNGSVTGDLTVTYAVTTNFGCKDTTEFIVSIFDTPIGTIDPVGTICIGQSVQLNAGGGNNYLWEPTNLVLNDTIPNPIGLPTDTTVFSVLIYDDIECPDTQTIEVDVLKEINGVVGSDVQICAGESVQLLAEALALPDNGTVDFSWFPPEGLSDPNIANPIASPGSFTVYTVTISSGLCLPEQANVTVEVSGSPFVDAGENQIVNSGEVVDLNAFSPNIVTYNWFDSEGNFINNTQSFTTPPITGTEIYYVEVGNAGCAAKDSVIILVLESCDQGLATVPNVFTPNGDGINDILKVKPGLGIAEVSTFKIFNRWGEIVFEADAASSAWDGTQSGKELDPGVYVYYMELICTDDSRSIRKGNITLLK